MSGIKPNLEVEIKLRVPDARRLLISLKQLRARVMVPRTYESNTLYDTPSRSLTRKDELVRIRIEQPSPRGSKVSRQRPAHALLTYKVPSRSSPSSRAPRSRAMEGSRYKIRDEIEVIVGSGAQMSRILRGLGLHPVFCYEKFRTTYALPGIPGLKVEFDETPIGLFLELEGSATTIDRAARFLGYTRSDYMTESYGALYIADCLRRGRKPSNMLFQPTKKLHEHALFP